MRRGRPKLDPAGSVRLSVRLPNRVYDELCAASRQSRDPSLSTTVRRQLTTRKNVRQK